MKQNVIELAQIFAQGQSDFRSLTSHLSNDEKQLFVALIQGKYPSIVENCFEAFTLEKAKAKPSSVCYEHGEEIYSLSIMGNIVVVDRLASNGSKVPTPYNHSGECALGKLTPNLVIRKALASREKPYTLKVQYIKQDVITVEADSLQEAVVKAMDSFMLLDDENFISTNTSDDRPYGLCLNDIKEDYPEEAKTFDVNKFITEFGGKWLVVK